MIKMKTFMEMAALLGEPVYDENLSEESVFDTVIWAFRSLSKRG